MDIKNENIDIVADEEMDIAEEEYENEDEMDVQEDEGEQENEQEGETEAEADLDLDLDVEMDIKTRASKKIEKELKEFKGGTKETAVSKFVASTLTKFCEENERFAEVVFKTPRTLSDCCAEVMDGCGNAISDIDVYRGAVQHYFPNADIHFFMEIAITGDDPTEEEINREPKKKGPAPRKTKEPKSKPSKPKKESVKPSSNATPEAVSTTAQSIKPLPKQGPKVETLQLTLF